MYAGENVSVILCVESTVIIGEIIVLCELMDSLILNYSIGV